jgi:hypothetical protein
MKKTKCGVLLVIFVISILIIGGCSRDNNQFYDNYEQFKNSFMVATDFIENDKDLERALSTIDYEQMNKEMEKMKKSYDQMGSLLKTDREKGIYGNVTSYYQEVEFIEYAAKNFNNLTIDQKRELGLNAISIKSDRESIKKGEV